MNRLLLGVLVLGLAAQIANSQPYPPAAAPGPVGGPVPPPLFGGGLGFGIPPFHMIQLRERPAPCVYDDGYDSYDKDDYSQDQVKVNGYYYNKCRYNHDGEDYTIDEYGNRVYFELPKYNRRGGNRGGNRGGYGGNNNVGSGRYGGGNVASGRGGYGNVGSGRRGSYDNGNVGSGRYGNYQRTRPNYDSYSSRRYNRNQDYIPNSYSGSAPSRPSYYSNSVGSGNDNYNGDNTVGSGNDNYYSGDNSVGSGNDSPYYSGDNSVGSGNDNPYYDNSVGSGNSDNSYGGRYGSSSGRYNSGRYNNEVYLRDGLDSNDPTSSGSSGSSRYNRDW